MASGALINAGTAMMAMSSGMSTISDNIANLSTTGYKATTTGFKTLLSGIKGATSAGSNGAISAGGISVFGVQAFETTSVSKQGTVVSTGNWTDLAINGKGLFVVAQSQDGAVPTSASLTDTANTLYTRAGSFQQSAVGDKSYLVTAGGQYLMGWQADASGAVTAGAALVPVYTEPGQVLDGLATSSLTLAANIPSNAALSASPVVKEFTTTDEAGAEQTLNATWTRTDGDTWTVSISDPDGEANIIGDPINVTLDSGGNVVLPIGGTADLIVDWPGGPSAPTVDLAAITPSISEVSTTVTVYDPSYSAHSLDIAFEHSASGQWYLRIKPDAAEGVVTGLTGTDAEGNESSGGYSIPITFDGAGAIISPTSVGFDIGWTDGSAGTSAITLDLSKLTQLAGDSSTAITVSSIEQDGYPSGAIDSTAFDSEGNLVASFSNGHTRVLFQVPLADFASDDSLDPVSGTLFRRTAAAGDVSIAAITDQGDGAAFSPESLESSNVVLEDEFTRMIVTQKAYSTNSTVFKTADEMMMTARDLL